MERIFLPTFPTPAAAVALCLMALLAGCADEPTDGDYAARVGDQVLTETEVSEALRSLSGTLDSTEARTQIIEQWVTNALLYQEAQRRNLRDDPAVQERLREQERAVLINALTNRLYDDFSPDPSPAEIQAYYERHREQLRIREPYLRIRHLATSNINTARDVREELSELDASAASDSLWAVLIDQHAAHPDEARRRAATYQPASQLFPRRPAVREALDQLDPGATTPVIRSTTDSLAHVLQLVDRAETGTIPERAWVEPQIRQRLAIRARKQMMAREVERLRNEARAQNKLDIR